MGKYDQIEDWEGNVKQFMSQKCSLFRSPCTMLSKFMHNAIMFKRIIIIIRYAKPA